MRVNKDGQRLLLDGTVIVAVDRSRGSRQGLHKGLCCAQCWNQEKGGAVCTPLEMVSPGTPCQPSFCSCCHETIVFAKGELVQ